MPSTEKITDVVKKSCEEIKESIKGEDIEKNDAAEVIKNVIETFFTQLRKSGYSVYLDEYLEYEHEKKSKKCIDLAKESIYSFKESNTNLKNIAESHTIEIESIVDNSTEIDIPRFKSRIEAFQNDLMEELQRANELIKSLESEIEELQKQSNIDPLTKLYNRKALEIDAKELLKHSNERNLNMALLMIDADDFKKVNDTFGHLAGDKVLILLAKLFKLSIREYDRAYRYGGEEFLIIFNRTGKEETRRVAERIMNAVRNNKLIYKGKVIRITLSMGLTAHQKGDTLESMIERADAAVYQAKNEGKDRLVVR
ncbi:diguanylate cyclase (GGDEF domain) with PAS/PAC sensor [Hydrogenimonas sp.]|nr:diguanylate cyclase (GGDEF domain) with PAS/PAC sensor [Hydrogenimonas sp.]